MVKGRELLTARDVLVVDEAGMVGTRQMERVLSAAAEAGAKVVLVGDTEQLQAIEAGAAFRSIVAIGLLHLFPEHGAAWILGTGQWEAGQRLMASASPETWKKILEGQVLYHDNRPVIKLCRTQAHKTGEDQKCLLTLKVRAQTH